VAMVVVEALAFSDRREGHNGMRCDHGGTGTRALEQMAATVCGCDGTEFHRL